MKRIITTIAVGLALMAALPAVAATTTKGSLLMPFTGLPMPVTPSTPSPKALSPCVKAAVAARNASLAQARQTYYAAVKAARDTRNAAVKAAKGDKTAIAAANAAYKTAVAAAASAYAAAKKAASDQYKTALAACKS